MLLRVGEMISLSWKSYKKYFRSLTTYLLLSLGISIIFSLIFFVPFILKTFFPNTFSDTFVWLTSIPLFLILAYFLFQFLIGFELRLRQALHNEKHFGFMETLRKAKPLIVRSIGISLLTGIFTSFPLLIGLFGIFGEKTVTLFQTSLTPQAAENFTLPPVELSGVSDYFFALLFVYGLFHIFYFSIVFSMSFNAVIFDRKNIKESLETSISLIQKRWWQVWWRLFAPQALLLAVYTLLSYLPLALGSAYGNTLGTFSDILVAFFINFFLAIPLIYLPAIVLYEDLKKNPLKKD